MKTVTLYRPVGSEELALIEASGWRRFPPRLPEQPIFYPVLNEEYATRIARDWNAKQSGSGYVTRFSVSAEFVARYSRKVVGSSVHEELWVPAEELAEFNRHILGRIEVIAEFHAERAELPTADPITLLFGGMEKLGPGADDQTLHVLGLLPTRQFRVVVDAGCGTGRQTLVLARELGVLVHAVDLHEPFLDDLVRRAAQAELAPSIRVHAMDMGEIPRAFARIDLLWSEGAAYHIGFANALRVWRPALAPGGFAVVSELSWLTERAPDAAREFFRTAYPQMRSTSENARAAIDAGYELLTSCTLPRRAWIDGYYDTLGPRATALLDHPDPAVSELAAGTLREIEVFEASADSYGYVFYVLRRP
jgi:SAM-dependent methyltransferase